MSTFLLYIDPGSGGYIIQMLVAGVLGVAYFFKNIRMYIMSFFYKKKKDENDQIQNDDTLNK